MIKEKKGETVMYISERQWDERLRIVTTGLDASHADLNRSPYEPTPYTVLDRLVESGYVKAEDRWLDYGCGKGRVGFFLNRHTGCHVTGVEYDQTIFDLAQANVKTYGGSGVEFVCANAETYEIGWENCFYFFNPFSPTLLQGVLARIVKSFYEAPRHLRLFFYYPSDEYRSILMASEFSFVEELDCMDLFAVTDHREKILIFEMPVV